MSYAEDAVSMSPDTWNTAATPAKAGSSDSNDLVNAVTTTINSLIGALNTVGFVTGTKNLITALEDFGPSITAALACVSIDLEVVGSGVAAAASAFAATDAALAKMFAELDTQLAYYTNTATSVTLATPTAQANAALNSLTSGSADDGGGFSWSMPNLHVAPPSPATTTGILGVVVVVGIIILLSPVGA